MNEDGCAEGARRVCGGCAKGDENVGECETSRDKMKVKCGWQMGKAGRAEERERARGVVERGPEG